MTLQTSRISRAYSKCTPECIDFLGKSNFIFYWMLGRNIYYSHMFTLSQIQEAHSKVKSGADFPSYAEELAHMWVTAYDTFVSDGHSVYLGNESPLVSWAKYDTLSIENICNKEKFLERLKLHQQWWTDYMTFCRDCAESGVEKWTLDLQAKSCTYSDILWNTLLVEYFGK